MPRPRTLKGLFIDVVVFVGMFALLGHLSINFWERFVIQSELSNMKTSLHSLKETINKIGFAYDNLHRELVGLAEIADKKMNMAPDIQDPKPRKKKNSNQIPHDIDIQARVQAKNHTTLTVPIQYDKTVQHFIENRRKDKTTQNVVQAKPKILSCPPKSNISTLTRYPPKSTGVGLDSDCLECPSQKCCRYAKISHTDSHRCCREYECYNPSDNWKF